MTGNTNTILTLILIVLITSVLGLGGWFLFLRARSDTIVSHQEARGLGLEAPSFTGPVGSTFNNTSEVVSSDSASGDAPRGTPPPQLWHVSRNPVAGASFVHTADGDRLYFVERASGNVFSADFRTGIVVRLTNTLMPKIYEAGFSSDGAVVQRALDVNGNATLFVGTIESPATDSTEASSTLGSLIGTFFSPPIHSFAIDPTSRRIAYITQTPSGSWVGVQRGWDGSEQKGVFESALSQWQLFWLADGRTIIAQNAADGIPGYAYEVSKSGSLVPLLKGLPGLVILPHTGSKTLLYSTSQNGTLSLYSVTGSGVPLSIPLKTTAEKCVWSPGKNTSGASDDSEQRMIAYCAVPRELAQGDILNNWYKGRYHMEDAWWSVDAVSGDVSSLVLPGEAVDVERPVINDDGSALAFINAIDKSLWLLQIPAHPNE